jgi:hypothetical protein
MMKAFLGVLAFMAFLILVSCEQAPVSPLSASPAPSAQIAVADVNTTVTPVIGAVFNSCTRELVEYEGAIHQRVTTKTKKDGSSSFEINVLIKGAGVGKTSGTQYQFIQHQDDVKDFEVGPPFPYVRVLDRTVRLISQGDVTNTYVIFRTELNVDSNGRLVSRIVSSTTTCQ